MKMSNKGFTLVEVVVVVAILALLGVLVMPNILNSLDIGKKSSDRVLYGDIKEAMQVMYEEKAYTTSNIYYYDNNGKDESNKITIDSESNSITTNIQTLISNGFLTGVNNEDLSINKNKRIVVNSNGDDLWSCEVKITKTMKASKVCYVVEGSGEGVCPSTEDFGGNTQCGGTQGTNTVTFYNGSNSIGTQSMNKSTKTTLTSWSSLGSNVLSEYNGWSFAGWATSDSSNKVKYKNEQDISITGDTDLYAIYSRDLTINYNANGGSGNIDAITKDIYINSNSTTTSSQEIILKDNFFIYDGYVFDKWTIGDKDYLVDESYEPNIPYNDPTFMVNVYAKWIPNTYIVKYNGNGSTSGSMADSNYVYGVSKKLTTNAFSKNGYYFAGWATSSDGNVVYSDGQDVNNLTTTNGGTVNLYAKWDLNKYTVKYNGNGNNGGSMSSSTHNYGVAKNLTVNSFTKTGYHFIGWSTSGDGDVVYNDGQSVTNLLTTNGGTVNLYAKWEPITYVIEYDANGGTGAPTSQTKIYGTSLTLSSVIPTLEGYDFLGWSTSSTATTPTYAAGGIYSSNVTTTLYAVWGKNYLINSSTSNFRSDTYREKIKKISFVDYIDTTNSVDSWDMSTLQNEGIMAWVVNNSTSGYYDLYIGSEKIIKGRDMDSFFYEMTYVDGIDFSNLDTSEVTNMRQMFMKTGYNSIVFTLNLGDNFVTSKVTEMSNMFFGTGYSSTVFSLDLGDKFDTSNVTNMRLMFYNTGYNSTVFTLDLGEKFDTSKVKNMNTMFGKTGYGSPIFTLKLGEKFDTSNVTNMTGLFEDIGYRSTKFTLDLGEKFDTSNVTSMSRMFANAGYSSPIFTLDLGEKFDTSNVYDMHDMFYTTGLSSTVFTLDLGENFDTSKVINMKQMFYGTGDRSPVFTLNLGEKFDTSNVTDMSRMFSDTGFSSTVFTLDLGENFDTSKVTNMSYMFRNIGYSSPIFTLDLGEKFDTSNVKDMSYMFCQTGYGSKGFKLDLGENFDTSKVTNMSYMFYLVGKNSTVFTLDLGNKFDTSQVTDMSNMFPNAGYANTNLILDLRQFNFSKVINYTRMFYGFNSTQKIYVKNSSDQTWLLNKDFSGLSTNNVIVKG